MTTRLAAAIGAGIVLAACSTGARCETEGMPICRGTGPAPAPAPAEEPQVLLEGTVVRASGDDAEGVGNTLVLPDEETQALLKRLVGRPGTALLAAPAVVAMDRQESTVSVGNFPDALLSFRAPESAADLDLRGASGFALWVVPRIAGDDVTLNVKAAWKDKAGPPEGRATRVDAKAWTSPGRSLVAVASLDPSDPAAPGRLILVVKAHVILAKTGVAAK